MTESIRRVREAALQLVDAHLQLLRAELAVLGREIGIIIGLAIVALALAALTLTLIVVGGLLFLGEWLFGSMAWGIAQGTLFFIAIIAGIGLNLAGAWMGAYVRGFAVGITVTVVLSVIFASNVIREAAVWAGRELEATVALEPALLPTLVGLVAGAVVLAVVMLMLGRGTGASWPQLLVVGLLAGALVGAVLGSVTFDLPGAVAVSLTLGLAAWPVSAGLLAVQRGIDPEARYSALLPRASIEAAQGTREYVTSEWRRQLKRMMGR